MAGQYNLALTQMKLQFVGGLASLLVEAASAYADRRLRVQAPMIAALRNWMEAVIQLLSLQLDASRTYVRWTRLSLCSKGVVGITGGFRKMFFRLLPSRVCN